VADHKWVSALGFTFDRVFPSPTGQAEIFDFGVKGIVEGKLSLIRTIVSEHIVIKPFLDVMSGFNGTLFCYGQTGSGKTVGLGLLFRYQDAHLHFLPRGLILDQFSKFRWNAAITP